MSKVKRIRKKHCDHCYVNDLVLYRVKSNKIKDWLFVCKTCQLTLKDKPGYQYGGTWKCKKRH